MNHETAVSNAKEIANRILAPAARQNDKEARFSSEAIAALGSVGLLGIMLPTEVGGSALGPRTLAAVIATLAEAVRRIVRLLIDERGHHRVTIDPAVTNAAAIRAYEKVGFKPVGVMRSYERDVGGEGWHDGLLMELLADK
jgi:RimJ/RimL family protein N-acetyltransferase